VNAVTTLQGGCRSQKPANSPVVSIIVVVFRDRLELEQLLANLAPFRCPEVELIVIDGGSDDGTGDVLKGRSDEIDFWLSERDSGIYDAMNKGISAARGEFVLHVNAGDQLLELPLAQLNLLAESEIDVVCCRVLEDDSNLFIPRNDWLLRFDNTWHHQGTFYRRARHMLYDPSYRVFGDFDHNQRLRRAECSVQLLDTIVATHRTDGVSRGESTRSEIFRSIRSNFGPLHQIPAFVRFQILRLRSMICRRLSEGSKSDDP
jgi:glycosyltransferase involved in cell wall biosynthesis